MGGQDVVAGKAIAFAEALKPEFKAYAEQVIANARLLAQSLAAGGVKLVSGGTDNHLMLVDVTPLGLGGKLAEEASEMYKKYFEFESPKCLHPCHSMVSTFGMPKYKHENRSHKVKTRLYINNNVVKTTEDYVSYNLLRWEK